MIRNIGFYLLTIFLFIVVVVLHLALIMQLFTGRALLCQSSYNKSVLLLNIDSNTI